LPDSSVRRALLVGIDQYPDPRNNLNSCIADTLAFQDMLISSYGCDPANITMLHNQAATLDAVRGVLDTLFANDLNPGEKVIFFESSHGYRYPEGDTMVEVLCLYDAFLEDHELVQRSASLPPDTLTVVTDACHSGGLNKLFFPPGGTTVARAKVFQPSDEQATRDVGLLRQVSKFKFFGRAPTMDTGAVAKQFVPATLNGAVPKQKDAGAGALELNGVLFAACLADQTAAAGSPPTDNLSAFTYALTTQLDTTISVEQLKDKAAARLSALNMSQTPVVEAPIAEGGLLTDTFISMQPAAAGPSPSPAPPSPAPSSGGLDPGALATFLSELRASN
jgi:Caspase domain